MEGAKRSRRQYGQGSVDQLGPGLWRLRVFVGQHPVTGKPVQRGRRYHGTKAGAEKALNAFRREVEQEQEQQARTQLVAPRRATVSDVIELHLTALRDSRAPGTIGSYETAHRVHLVDGFGAKRVDKLTAQNFRDLYKWLSEPPRNLSASSIWTVYALLSGALTRAVREHGVPFDSKQLVTPKKPAQRKQQQATDEELAKLFRFSAAYGDDWPLLFRLACVTGMRRGELVALRWSTLDDGGTLYVDTNIVAIKGSLITKPPKSGDPRFVKLDDETVRRWLDLRARREDAAASSSLVFQTDQYVFAAGPDTSLPRRPDRVTKVFEMLRTDLSINPALEFRALRNWNITILDDELGFDLAKIARRVGHSHQRNASTSMTSHYSLRDRKVDAEMASGISDYLKKVDATAAGLPEP